MTTKTAVNAIAHAFAPCPGRRVRGATSLGRGASLQRYGATGVEKRPISASQQPTVPRLATDPSVRRLPRGEAPLVLGRYRLHRRLGAGAFGIVWMARDERLDRDVAVKIVPRERIVDQRFEREARAAARLVHPAIVTLYEAAADDQGAYLVSELVRGETLGDLLEAGRLSDREIVMIAIALCDALAHAHGQGIVHRDLKPSNVLVPERATTVAGLAKLTDFGVARVIGADSLTRTGEIVGTAAYMAPEQAEGVGAGAPADLYSLALVAYEALTGVNPVRTGTAAQRARRLGAHRPPLRRQRRDLPRELGQGIDLALRPRPRERGTVAELRRALALSVDQLHDTPGVVGDRWPRRPSAGVDHRWPRRQRESVDQHRTRAEPEALGAEALAPETIAPPVSPGEGTTAHGTVSVGWPARGLGAAAAAIMSAWLVSHALAPSPLAPAAAALVAGMLVAALPRLGWLALVVTTTGLLVLQGRPGGALVVLTAALVPVLLLPGKPASWPLGAGAPALGLVGLAGCWPAIAGRAASAWQRAALGATGWIWLAIAAPLADADLYARRPSGTPPASVWMPSLHETVAHVLAPLLTPGVLAGAPVWAAAAFVLPGLTGRRSPAVAVVLVTIWSATTVSATATVLALSHPRGAGTPATAVLGAVVGAVIALAPVAARRWRSSHRAVPLS
jgi:serine/threonine protein kinase